MCHRGESQRLVVRECGRGSEGQESSSGLDTDFEVGGNMAEGGSVRWLWWWRHFLPLFWWVEAFPSHERRVQGGGWGLILVSS